MACLVSARLAHSRASRGGRLTEPTPAIQPGERERVFVPEAAIHHSCKNSLARLHSSCSGFVSRFCLGWSHAGMKAGPVMFVSSGRQQVQAFDPAAWNSYRHIRPDCDKDRRGYPGAPGHYRFAHSRAAPLEPQPARATAHRCAGPSVGPGGCTRLGCRFPPRYRARDRPNSYARAAPPRQCPFTNTIGQISENRHAPPPQPAPAAEAPAPTPPAAPPPANCASRLTLL